MRERRAALGGAVPRRTVTAPKLSLEMKDAMSLSYPRLYQLHRAETPSAPEFMVFAPEIAPSP